MQKNSTLLKKTDLLTEKKTLEINADLQPSANTIQNILQFASSYRAQKIANNQFVEWFVN
ncbi:MAG: hypothetical protein PHS59_12760 [Paludibacter sp.]|nr:hypothetical protein [Paludibacter sp.]